MLHSHSHHNINGRLILSPNETYLPLFPYSWCMESSSIHPLHDVVMGADMPSGPEAFPHLEPASPAVIPQL